MDACQPGLDLGVPTRAVVVDDHVDIQIEGHAPFHSTKEAEQFLVPVPWHALVVHAAGANFQGGEEHRRTVTLVVVRERPGASPFQRQSSSASGSTGDGPAGEGAKSTGRPSGGDRINASVIHQLIACAVESCLQPHNRAEVVIRQC